MEKFSYLRSQNINYIEDLFDHYKRDPSSVDHSWRFFFEGMELGERSASQNIIALPQKELPQKESPQKESPQKESGDEAKVADLINAYRERGKLLAHVDPLNPPSQSHPLLELSHFGLSEADLTKTFTAGKFIGSSRNSLSEIITQLKETYSRTIAVEFTHIEHPEARDWLQQVMESCQNKPSLLPELRKNLLMRLTQSETFERFLHTRYVAQKRFSLEGGECLILALDCMLEEGSESGAKEFVLGMAHRGRLNVLTHVMGKKPEYIFTEFEAKYKTDHSLGEGDVKYHKGYSSDFTTRKGKKIHLSLASNPSHLEFINPVVTGVSRAKQEALGDFQRSQVIPILIHGDAAFAGQGICYETLNLSQLEGYTTGGTLHVVINNQVGFTAGAHEGRSTTYCTDLAKMLDVPIFHVNGDDPEAVWFVSKLATQYRQKFKSDVFVDLICYRKHGHNEADEPSFTQPVMYKKIKAHPSTREIYAKKLTELGILSETEATQMVDQVTEQLSEAQKLTQEKIPQPYISVFENRWEGFKQPSDEELFGKMQTAVETPLLKELSKKMNSCPPSFHLHPKLTRFFEARHKAIEEGKAIDWGNGETLAYATLLLDGYPIRLSGQDVGRGTFTHRHALLHDCETGEVYTPLNHLADHQALFSVYNSHLSESAVMGFEFGYASAEPKTLVIWEAQFGDFANGAQVIIDQFIASTESKWQRMNGLVLFLPHGQEGQGPEHSSGRLERFLSLCGKNNMFVCNFTTPAQLFHALRRHMKRNFRKPMVVMTPKSLLRHAMAVSSLEEFTRGSFQEILDEPNIQPEKIKKLLLCNGKIYYDLLIEKINQKIPDIAILRIEQLYPWPEKPLLEKLSCYKNADKIFWVQEEPKNMGAWSFVFNEWSGGLGHCGKLLGEKSIGYIGREVGAAPAVGSAKLHAEEQKTIIQEALKK